MRIPLCAADAPDAVFCANDNIAIAAIEVAPWEFGLSPGCDTEIGGYDDVEQPAWPSFDLTNCATRC